jgi:hypothetical protein
MIILYYLLYTLFLDIENPAKNRPLYYNIRHSLYFGAILGYAPKIAKNGQKC